MPVVIKEKGNIERTLQRMPMVLRTKSLKKAARKGGNEQAKAARRFAPPPGYPGDKPGNMALNKTIRVRVVEYDTAIVAVVGPKWPEGAHGHLVEFGHAIRGRRIKAPFLKGHERHTSVSRSGQRTTPKPFMRQAEAASLRQQQAAVIKSLRGDVQELAK